MQTLQQDAGYSLIEVVVALAIFSVGMLAVAGLQASSIRGNVSAREMTVTTSLGQSEIERLLALPFEHPDLVETAGQSRNWQAGSYRYRLEVVQDELLTNTKTIRLDVESLIQGPSGSTRLVAVKANL